MNELEPKYITELKNNLKEFKSEFSDFKSEMTGFKGEFSDFKTEITGFRGEFNDFRTEAFSRMDSHAEQIAHVSEEIVGVKKILNNHSSQLQEIKESLDEKADTAYVNQIHNRTKKLEKHVFA